MGKCQSGQDTKHKNKPLNNENIVKALKKLSKPFKGMNSQGLKSKYIDRWCECTGTHLYLGGWHQDTFQGQGMLYSAQTQELLIAVFQDGKPRLHFCRKVLKTGSVFTGQLNEKWELTGKGKLQNQEWRYEGQFSNNKFHGYGHFTNKVKKENFEGQFVDGLMHKGTLIKESGIFCGEFKHGKIHGFGSFIWSEGGRYEGEFKNNSMNGKGNLYDCDGRLVRKFKDKFNDVEKTIFKI